MSSKVGSIFYEVDADTSKFDKATNNIDQKLGKLGKTLKSVGTKMTLGLTLPLIAAGTAAFKSAADYEQLQIAMETMLGSAEKAKNILSDLDELAVKTPFEISEVQDAARQMLAYGIEADKVVDTTKMLGDVSAGLGTSTFPQLTLAFGQIKAKGKLMGQELLQLTNAGFNLAEAMGVSRGELMEMMETGEGVTFEQVEQAFIDATSEGGRFNNMMQNQSETTAGKLSNLKDELERLGRSIGTLLLPYVESFIEKMKVLVEWFKSLSPEQQKMIVIIGALIAVLGPLLVMLGMIATAIAAIGTTTLLVVGAIGVIVGALYLLEQKTGIVSTVITWLIDKVRILYNWFMENLYPALKQVAAIIMEQLKPAWDNFREALNQAWESIKPWKEELKLVAKVIGAVLLGALVVITAALVGLAVAIAHVIKWVSSAIKWFANLQAKVSRATRTVYDSVNNLRSGIVNVFTGAVSWLWNAGRSIIQGLVNGIKSKVQDVKNAVSGVMQAARDYLPFSPAKEGPFSGKGWTLYSGKSMMEGLAEGIQSQSYQPKVAMKDAMQGVSNTQNNNTSIYGNITIGSQKDSDDFFRRLSRNQELTTKGLATL